MSDIQYKSIGDRYEHLLSVMSSERFKKKEGLGNEVPFFICPFKTKETVEIEKLQRQLANKLTQSGVPVLEINLYDLAIEILKENDDWDYYLEQEVEMTKDRFKEELQSILDIETVFTPEIAKKMKNATFDIMFITGVGEVFPYIRSHNILNNLQKIAKDKPTVMFFPGDYRHSLETGASLELFEKLRDDKYYRAFNIFHYEV
ncbi:DUF1788 domain-containing protein [Sulfuricurvum sp.]|uniref:DUF1788 domain-containing protein n=1 Tax=Sulfuricurvum sp. TaxID=2025608 RepID=UPI00260E6372|nr:DUF1788 domain-containing protein [Sulfuricurvum sp.]MDD4950487.1 DUF1788 domain-containing protein [Sulfuricurvum sp.]